MKGCRVQAVVQELRGEKIDIVPWDEDPARFVCNALAPGRGLAACSSTSQNHAMELIVPDDQLSLAIGRRGQNVRLASQLTGWKLDINSETRVKEMREFATESFERHRRPRGHPGDALRPRLPQGAGRGQRRREMLTQFPGFDHGHDPGPAEAGPRAVHRRRREGDAARGRSARRPASPRPGATPTRSPRRSAWRASAASARRPSRPLKAAGLPDRRGHPRRGGRQQAGRLAPGSASRRPGRSSTPSGVYLEEEARLRDELDAEKARHGVAGLTATPERTCVGCGEAAARERRWCGSGSATERAWWWTARRQRRTGRVAAPRGAPAWRGR